MKVRFKYGIRTYSGTIDEMTYGSYRDHKLCIGREWVMPTLTEQNGILGTIGSNLRDLWFSASEDYRGNFKTYAQRHCTQNVPKTQACPNGYAMFIKACYAWQDDDPEHVDLASVNDEDVDTLGTKISTVKNCIDNDFLPAISEYDDLTGAF